MTLRLVPKYRNEYLIGFNAFDGITNLGLVTLEEFIKAHNHPYNLVAHGRIRAGTITADFWDGEPLPCYGNSETWNGWGVPLFPWSSVGKLLVNDDMNLSSSREDADGAITIFHINGDNWEMQTIKVNDETIEVWAIGAMSWTWDRIEFKE